MVSYQQERLLYLFIENSATTWRHILIQLPTPSYTSNQADLNCDWQQPTKILVQSSKDIVKLLDITKNVEIPGNLNAKYSSQNSRKLNPAGSKLFRYIDDTYDMIVAASTTSTRYPIDIRQSPHILEISILKTGQIGH